jgi:hypothetical protein
MIVPLQFPLFNQRSDLLYDVLIRPFFLDRFQHGLASSLFLSSSIAALKCAAVTESFSWLLPAVHESDRNGRIVALAQEGDVGPTILP